jgi:hypothetical protein
MDRVLKTVSITVLISVSKAQQAHKRDPFTRIIYPGDLQETYLLETITRDSPFRVFASFTSCRFWTVIRRDFLRESL